MLRRPHDHHRNLRPLVPAQGAAASHHAIREKFAVTRHGLPRSPAAAPPLRPMFDFAPSVVTGASKPPLAGHRHRHADPIHQRCAPIPSPLTLPTTGPNIAGLSRKPKSP